MARHDPHGKEDLGERFSQFASVCGITDGHDLRSANDTPALNALKALRGAPISMGRSEIPVGGCQPPSGFAISPCVHFLIQLQLHATISLEAWCCGHREEVAMSTDHSSPYNSLAGKRTYTVEEIAKILGIGRTTAYSLVHSGVFKAVRIGSSIRVSKVSFDDWLDIEP